MGKFIRYLACFRSLDGYVKVGKSCATFEEAQHEAQAITGGVVISREFVGKTRICQELWPKLKKPIAENINPMTMTDEAHWDASDNGDEAEPYHLQ